MIYKKLKYQLVNKHQSINQSINNSWQLQDFFESQGFLSFIQRLSFVGIRKVFAWSKLPFFIPCGWSLKRSRAQCWPQPLQACSWSCLLLRSLLSEVALLTERIFESYANKLPVLHFMNSQTQLWRKPLRSFFFAYLFWIMQDLAQQLSCFKFSI